MPYCQGLRQVFKVVHSVSQSFEIVMLCLKSHAPLSHKWSIPVEKYFYIAYWKINDRLLQMRLLGLRRDILPGVQLSPKHWSASEIRNAWCWHVSSYFTYLHCWLIRKYNEISEIILSYGFPTPVEITELTKFTWWNLMGVTATSLMFPVTLFSECFLDNVWKYSALLGKCCLYPMKYSLCVPAMSLPHSWS
jgi:hypothetical protein